MSNASGLRQFEALMQSPYSTCFSFQGICWKTGPLEKLVGVDGGYAGAPCKFDHLSEDGELEKDQRGAARG